jgi:hypothetical protein
MAGAVDPDGPAAGTALAVRPTAVLALASAPLGPACAVCIVAAGCSTGAAAPLMLAVAVERCVGEDWLAWADAAGEGLEPVSVDSCARRICERASAADGLVAACAEVGAIRAAVLGVCAAWLLVTCTAAG